MTLDLLRIQGVRWRTCQVCGVHKPAHAGGNVEAAFDGRKKICRDCEREQTKTKESTTS